MPIIKSAKKRVNTAYRQGVENAKTKKSLRVALKAFQNALSNGQKVDEAQNVAQSALDTAVKKGIISKNKAARKKSQLSTAAKAVGSTRTTAKKEAKPAAKKAPAKKTVAKKPATKK